MKKSDKFTGPNKVYWYWVGGSVLIVRSAFIFY